MNHVEQATSFILLPQADLETLKAIQLQILDVLKTLQGNNKTASPVAGYLTAIEFMKAVKICRSKFDQLASTSKIKVIKKKRKLYVPLSEVERNFTDPSAYWPSKKILLKIKIGVNGTTVTLCGGTGN